MKFPKIGLGNWFKQAADGAAGGFLNGAAEIIGKFVADPTEKAKALKELEEAKLKHDEVMANIAMEAEKIASQERINEDNQVTERWRSDMSSDSMVSKNIRPLTLAFVVVMFFLIMIFDSAIKTGFEVDSEYKDIVKVMLEIIIVAYYGSRGAEKVIPQFKRK